ncbi:Piwi-domain-containing protein [Cylindrobasidium torrendii FP15055 ss-10]|uniref:Piwi-domain-containing protein n=1 Tax=Cylindrobasidium torrendii FP15055 ss-10 TaxID=1314674 RepID=A0A0D7BH06_9AGAR|nr:Piwi-domain-containing protein [Cylindrobasidium torrendii FP15055 ss-10]
MAQPTPAVQFSDFLRSRRPTSAHVNAFLLDWKSDGRVYHYDADMEPQWPLPPEDNGEPGVLKIGPRKSQEIMRQLQTSVAASDFPVTGVFDNKKNLFSFYRYQFDEKSWHVEYDWRSGKHRILKITIKFVKEVNVDVLRRLVNGDRSAQVSEHAAQATNMINMAVQAAPRSATDVLSKGMAFYIKENRARSQRTEPFELWRGFSQSIRLTTAGIVLNVDITVGTVIPEMPAEAFAIAFLASRLRRPLRDPRDLANFGPQSNEFVQLNRVFRTLKLKALHLKNQNPISFKKLIPCAGEYEFEHKKEGRMLTVAQYFKQTYNRDIRQREIGTMSGRGSVVPLSCVIVELQLFKGEVTPDLVNEILNFIPRNPQDRMGTIQRGWNHLGLQSSEFLQNAKITVDSRARELQGNLLPRPMMVFGGDRTVPLQNPDAKWDVRSKKLHTPGTIESWNIVNFVSNPDRRAIEAFCHAMQDAMRALGIVVGGPPQIFDEPAQGNIEQSLRQRSAKLIVAILPDPAESLYVAVKRFGDITQGVATQCVRWSRKRATKPTDNQYINNILLKANAKIGGRNFVPSDMTMKFLGIVPTMVVGADVSHPAPGSSANRPSIASVVASIDRLASRYTAKISVQEGRVEMIQNLKGMLKECLSDFFQANSALPQRIIFYRDGVSEQEMQQVLDKEFNSQFKGAVEEFYKEKGCSPQQRPTYTLIVVTKRHHIRFFPSNPGNKDTSQNCQAGFVVDQALSAPQFEDFFLQSQVGLKGTSVPGHYTILYDEIFGKFLNRDAALAKQAIEQFTYTLCHSYCRATRSVKIPAPVYYADLVCRRGKFHLNDNDNASTNSQEFDLEYWKRHFLPLHDRIARLGMFFV